MCDQDRKIALLGLCELMLFPDLILRLSWPLLEDVCHHAIDVLHAIEELCDLTSKLLRHQRVACISGLLCLHINLVVALRQPLCLSYDIGPVSHVT